MNEATRKVLSDLWKQVNSARIDTIHDEEKYDETLHDVLLSIELSLDAHLSKEVI